MLEEFSVRGASRVEFLAAFLELDNLLFKHGDAPLRRRDPVDRLTATLLTD